MAVYRPKYRDQKTGKLKQSKHWWYEFVFAGKRIRESTESTRKTIAIEAEKNRRLDLERGYNQIEDKRQARIRTVGELVKEFLEAYKLRHPKSSTFAEYALGHVKRLMGKLMVVDVTDTAVKDYQTARLKEKAAPKSINEETGFLLRILGEQGDFLRAKLRRQSALKLKRNQVGIAKAFSPKEKAALLAEARKRRSPSIYPALMLALHAGMRDAEIRGLQWRRVDLQKAIVTVGDSKTAAGEGRTIPLNADMLAALVEHSRWFLDRFGLTEPGWFVFPFGKPQPTDPTRQATSFKTVWAKVKKNAGVEGRWHDGRHMFITDLAESGEASDETIQELAGHVSKQMLKHYSHIRMEAKRRAVLAIAKKPAKKPGKSQISSGVPQDPPKVARFT
jgi:integrase